MDYQNKKDLLTSIASTLFCANDDCDHCKGCIDESLFKEEKNDLALKLMKYVETMPDDKPIDDITSEEFMNLIVDFIE